MVRLDSHWVRAVVVLDANVRDPLSKVGLDSVDTDVEQALDQARVPLVRLGIGKVDTSHACLPFVPTSMSQREYGVDFDPTHHWKTSPLDRLIK